MRISYQDSLRLEELDRAGIPLDRAVLAEARTRLCALEIMQTGSVVENVVFARPEGGIGISAGLDIENVSDRIIPITAVRLKMPWTDADFRWLPRLSSKEVRESGGYVLPASGPAAFDPSIVINHRFTREFKLFPGDRIEGLLLGEGRASVPHEYHEGLSIPMQLVVYRGRDDRFCLWLKLVLWRIAQRGKEDVLDKLLQSKTAHPEKAMA